ncbi:DoxX family protein [Maribacter sp. 4G9]|uniref:DoxX family protein n=1 Tax=Maribacter sp. 4G9 TaxID=1889777 RepID=UPI000C15E4E7|nr:DoxX family protein [Maribacter sp. 4G9]PIB23358.1 DoxX family protein [Maribacter sp. 4G9]
METIREYASELILLLFLAITFLQSGMDKFLDWKGNVGWLKGHFSKTFFKDTVPLLLGTILLLEVLSGITSLLGIYELLNSQNTNMAFWSAIVGCLTLLMLLFGQRVAKDYDGARTIVIYLMPTVFLLFLLQN